MLSKVKISRGMVIIYWSKQGKVFSKSLRIPANDTDLAKSGLLKNYYNNHSEFNQLIFQEKQRIDQAIRSMPNPSVSSLKRLLLREEEDAARATQASQTMLKLFDDYSTAITTRANKPVRPSTAKSYNLVVF